MAIRYLVRKSENTADFTCEAPTCSRSSRGTKPYRVFDRQTNTEFPQLFDFETCGQIWLIANGMHDF